MRRDVACVVAALLSFPAFGQDKPVMITSDTVEYCNELQQRLARLGPGALDVQRLIAEGRKMCDHGEIRGGIVRLRRALLIQKRLGGRPRP